MCVQNDVIYGWAIDFKMGYCTKVQKQATCDIFQTNAYYFGVFGQGDRSKAVGVVDQTFVTHQNLGTLTGVSDQVAHLFVPHNKALAFINTLSWVWS